LAKNQFITTNQQQLFAKLIIKYQRQLKKHKIYNANMLEWKIKVVNSDTEYTEAHVSYNNEQLVVRVPFNRNFILDFIQEQKIKVLQWDKIDKCYKADFSTTALKAITNIVPNYFITNFDTSLNEKLKEVQTYKNQIWDPTLVEINGNYYIIACNESLYNNLPLNKLDNSPITLHTLSRYGVNIEPLIYTDNKLAEFSSHYINHVNLSELHNYKQYCIELGLTTILCSNRIKRIKLLDQVLKHFDGLNIIFEEKITQNTEIKNAVVIVYSDLALRFQKRYTSNKGIEKSICIVDDTPVNIK
jgi:hypothetical protein